MAHHFDVTECEDMSLRKYFRPFLFAIVLGIWFLVEHLWISLPMSGRVIDFSGKPVQGAVVLAAWTLKWGRAGTHGFVLREGKTDKAGQFHIPGWVRLSPTLFASMNIGPRLYIVESGHAPLVIHDQGDGGRFINATPKYVDPIRVVELPDLKQQAENKDLIDSYSTGLCIYWHPDAPRIWDSAPEFVEMMTLLQRRFGGDPSRFPCVHFLPAGN